MDFIEGAVLILFIAALSVPLASRLKLPLEIFLLIGSSLVSGIVSFIPGMPIYQIDPKIVFDVFLPPILFAAAYFTSWRDFKFNLRPITQLALGLVVFTTLIAALASKFLLPGFTWPQAFLLGAVISPTDASAAVSIIKKLGLPRRFVAILEGESLINDATALILYRFSLSAILYGSFSVSQALTSFIMISIGGMIVGFLVAFTAIFIIQKIKDVQAETTFTFITAFASFLIAQELNFSSIISTVTAGIYFGVHFPEFAKSHTRMNAKANWSMLLFIINSFVFTLIGFELPAALKNLEMYSLSELIFYGGSLSILVILIRLLWIYPSVYLPRLLLPSRLRHESPPSGKFLFILGWSGMRGIVSLAAALAIPRHTPHWNLLLFLTYFVVAATLIIPALTLPFLIKLFKFSDQTEQLNQMLKEESNARVLALEETINAIIRFAEKESIPPSVLEEFMYQARRKRKVIFTQLNETPYSMLLEEHMAFKKITLIAIEAERKVLLDLRKTGKIHDEVFRTLSEELDFEEMRSKSLRI